MQGRLLCHILHCLRKKWKGDLNNGYYSKLATPLQMQGMLTHWGNKDGTMVLWNKLLLLHLAEDTIVYDVRKATGLQWSPHIHTLLCCKQIWNCSLWLYTFKDGRLSSACQVQNCKTYERHDQIPQHYFLFFVQAWRNFELLCCPAFLPGGVRSFCACKELLKSEVESTDTCVQQSPPSLQCKFFSP